MPGPLTHSPADIVSRLLIQLGLGTEPPVAPALPGLWPVYTANEPDSPDNCITVYDTAGIAGPRTNPDGERSEYEGIQVRIRGATYPAGWAKAKSIAVALDETILEEYLSFESSAYLIHHLVRNNVLSLGNPPDSNRYLFSINAVLSVRQL